MSLTHRDVEPLRHPKVSAISIAFEKTKRPSSAQTNLSVGRFCIAEELAHMLLLKFHLRPAIQPR